MPYMMIGTQRSGSNLLRLMINQLSEITAPHPPHILEKLTPLLPIYGPLEKDKSFKQLIEDVCQLVEKNPVVWDGINLNRNEVYSECGERSLIAVCDSVHNILAQQHKAETWMCKSMANVHLLPEIERFYGKKIKFIYLYRDGRDVSLSFRKAMIGEKSFYHLAKTWSLEQKLALECEQRLGENQFFKMSYEELTSDVEFSLRRLCRFLNVDYSKKMLQGHKSVEATRTAVTSLWSNVVNPLSSNNCNKFIKECSLHDVGTFERVAKDSLNALGYNCFLKTIDEKTDFSDDEIKAFEVENESLKKEATASSDVVDRELRQPHIELMNSIRQRLR
jgi:hypothetical protein